MKLIVFTMHTPAYMQTVLCNTDITMLMVFMDFVKPGYPLSSLLSHDQMDCPRTPIEES